MFVHFAFVNILYINNVILHLDPCRQHIAASSSVIMSPNHPSAYPSNAYCEWFIDVGEGHAVLTFQSFYLEGSRSSCSYDWLKVCISDCRNTPTCICSADYYNIRYTLCITIIT